MYGPPAAPGAKAVLRDSEDSVGLIPRAVSEIFEKVSANKDILSFSVYCSFVQVYNENLYDMLRLGSGDWNCFAFICEIDSLYEFSISQFHSFLLTVDVDEKIPLHSCVLFPNILISVIWNFLDNLFGFFIAWQRLLHGSSISDKRGQEGDIRAGTFGIQCKERGGHFAAAESRRRQQVLSIFLLLMFLFIFFAIFTNNLELFSLQFFHILFELEICLICGLIEFNRAIRETYMNQFSSRSHSIFQIFVEHKRLATDGGEVSLRAKFNLVDLAGSEKWNTR